MFILFILVTVEITLEFVLSHYTTEHVN